MFYIFCVGSLNFLEIVGSSRHFSGMPTVRSLIVNYIVNKFKHVGGRGAWKWDPSWISVNMYGGGHCTLYSNVPVKQVWTGPGKLQPCTGHGPSTWTPLVDTDRYKWKLNLCHPSCFLVLMNINIRLPDISSTHMNNLIGVPWKEFIERIHLVKSWLLIKTNFTIWYPFQIYVVMKLSFGDLKLILLKYILMIKPN